MATEMQELNLMILLHLQSQNLTHAAATLEADLASNNLLPKRVDFAGNQHNLEIGDAVRPTRIL
jgi:hypothetical protein